MPIETIGDIELNSDVGTDANSSFKGKLSNVREFNRTLTAAEAMQLSNEVR